MSEFNFDCPHCNRAQVVTESNQSQGNIRFYMGESRLGKLGLLGHSIRCANHDCNMPTVVVEVHRWTTNSQWVNEEPLLISRLIPESMAKPQPEYIPKAIKEDYTEACRIRDLSPKASATLARRCLQGMIRDFCGVSERTLFAEIEKLKELSDNGNAPRGVSDDSIESLHHFRSLGNIGAHMEGDINLIIPVEPEEARIMIDLLETLFDEWYIARHKRDERLLALKAAAEEKAGLRSLPPRE